ncbi:response regulator [Roseateles amylovorans]|uniref:histidine kinase n=1 Tax=Roseateles amylovorans TaxID=2978473 RepID=A0ABY6AYJ9_9BURK|nr:response regulator [Roseateles amylovorans]UXH77353.1 response regulator [Roseateles amylovorans]
MNHNNEIAFIVEDSLTVRMDLREALEDAGFACVECATLAQARVALAHDTPALVLLDTQLPDGDGGHWLQELRGAPQGTETVVLILSNAAQAGDRMRGLAHGADEFVGKPYDRSYVVDRARELLRQRQSQRQDMTTTQGPSVLLIDDSETFRHALREALEPVGYRIHLAAHGEDGLRQAAALRPNAMIVDQHMPGLDGAAVIRRLRLDPALRHTPCLLLTADEGADAELRALEAGADAFARKQDDVDMILARVAAMLRSATASLPEQGASLLGPKRVLLVDDSPNILAELGAALRDDGFDVVPARSGEQALELLSVQAVDAVLMDVQMPGLGGLETCRRIKAAPAMRDIPVVLLTALDGRDAMLAGLEAGADDYVVKAGGEVELLKARLRAQLRRKQFEDEARRVHAELHHSAMEAAQARAARTLADSRAELLAALQQRNEALEQLNAELSRASSAKTAFLSTMSHELRTPLNAVIGFAQLMRDGAAGPVSPRQAEFCNHIHNAGQHLLSLVNDLLDMAKIEAGRVDLDFEAVDLDDLLRDALAIVQERTRLANIQVKLFGVGSGQRLCVDRRRLRQIIYNLLSNAAKFTPKGGLIRLEAERVTRARASTALPGFPTGRRSELPENDFQEFVQISITDSGIGIPADSLERLFQPFNQIKNILTHKVEGTGLGLATVSRLVQLHGGAVAVTSEPDRGSCFTCWLPWREPVMPDVVLPDDPAARPLALVIEHNLQAATLMQTQLNGAGFRVRHVTSAEEALALSEHLRPDLITLEVQLPGLDGWELLSRLKNLNGWAHIPVVVVSVDAGQEVALSLGASAVLHKPISRAALAKELEVLGFNPTDTRNFLVLAISEAPGDLQSLSTYLSQPGFSVLRATGGKDGIDQARRHVPDLIVLDLLMAEVDGIGVVEALQRDPLTAAIPVIVVAASQLTARDRELLNRHVQRARPVATVTSPAPLPDGSRQVNGPQGHFMDEVKRAISRTSWGDLDPLDE